MIFKTKDSLAKNLGCYRQKINAMMKRNEVKEVFDNEGNKLGYVHVINFIRELIKD